MKIVADLHIHSHFSRATSKNLTFEHLARWAQLKGVTVVATGDITHPGWLAEMREKLIPAEDGLYRLRDELAPDVQSTVPPACQAPVRFILSGEISNIYKRAGQTRKVHNVVFAPSLDVVSRLQARLEKIGNIRSDGRPILGLDSRDLLETLLEVDSACQLIPAHIWTPWFSLLGSKSGFDSVDECYGDLTPHIFALETGLSSDPPMNWRVSQLDRYALVSNSDAHSPEKLAREATLFDTELAYGALFAALRREKDRPAVGAFGGTIEFFPEEGKYHLDGHRSCGIVWEPQTTIAHGGLCPVCGKAVTIGVMHRVEELADRPPGGRPQTALPYTSLVPLPEVIGQVLGVGPGSSRVEQETMRLLGRLGPELFILREARLEDIAAVGGERLAQGIDRMRRGEVDARGGYDGEYGVIRLFTARGGGFVAANGQGGLFGDEEDSTQGHRDHKDIPGREMPEAGSEPMPADGDAGKPEWRAASDPSASGDPSVSPQASFFDLQPIATQAQGPGMTSAAALLRGLNEAQCEAVRCVDRSLIISAGPGTGKTRTLTHRIAYLVLEHGVAPESILAITFTNKAREEMSERLSALLGSRSAEITVKTFHAFAVALLRRHGAEIGLDPAFAILTEDDRGILLRAACPGLSQTGGAGGTGRAGCTSVQAALAAISAAKNRLEDPPVGDEEGEFAQVYRSYQAALTDNHALDFDDLIFQAVRLLETSETVRDALHRRYRWISVDEYQDVNAAQVRFLCLLADGVANDVRVANVCVIGDPDQAIYGFRGADRRYFLSFLSDYPGSVCLRLAENYRSTQTILDAALQVIERGRQGSWPQRPGDAGETGAGSTGRLPLRAAKIFVTYSEPETGQALSLIDVHEAPTDRAEAEYVVHQIEQMIGGTSHFSLDSGRLTGDASFGAHTFADFAVLYRLSAQSRLLIEAFERSGMPYQTIGQAPLTGHADVRKVLAALWCAYRMMVVDTGARHFQSAGHLGHQSAGHLEPQVTRLLAELGPRPPVVRLVERLPKVLGVGRDVAGAARGDRSGSLEQLARLAGPFGDRLGDYLEAMALHKETDAYDPRADRVTLMTLHAAKGLEFPAVFIVGCEEGLLPYMRDRGGGGCAAGREPTATGPEGLDNELEEERRLFYVGITRAQQKLVLCHARRRMLFGQAMENPVSRFVDDIESALKTVQAAGAKGRGAREPEPRQLSLF